MKKRFEQNARGSGLTRSQWLVLVYLAQNEGTCQRQLAELMELEPATLGRLVDRLVDSGLIERRADVSDRRIWQLHLTLAARSKLGAVRELGDRTRGEALSGLSEHDRRFLIKTLEQLKQNLIGCVYVLREPRNESAGPTSRWTERSYDQLKISAEM